MRPTPPVSSTTSTSNGTEQRERVSIADDREASAISAENVSTHEEKQSRTKKRGDASCDDSICRPSKRRGRGKLSQFPDKVCTENQHYIIMRPFYSCALVLVRSFASLTPSTHRSLPDPQLMNILDSKDYEAVFSWNKEGNAIVIHEPYDLVDEVLTTHFEARDDMKFDSFVRKLYRWGFSKLVADQKSDEGEYIYFHPVRTLLPPPQYQLSCRFFLISWCYLFYSPLAFSSR